ncbi:hypothetical protein B0F90DRAFT_1683624 [Multifurca ochricompacta]|uniref:Uncharacterized protein n=1 Tax=Multifurca ochricompacta TaxID=376703 RepID=A0AAD4MAR1_9AGAM|nr:hypothetical protein B0F90DRAFT_1683624 [Multifurca ochricompacta]
MTTVFPLPSPVLPEFSTLVLKGPYHASAPIHLCLTHVANRPGTKAVLLTPSRDNFIAALRDLNDDWLNECGGYGSVSQALSRVDVFYPPTPAHASLALSMLRVSRPEIAPSSLEIASPCLVLLHEISSYFLDGNNSGLHTLASYLSLVAHALSTLRSLSEQVSGSHVSLVLMDSRLDSLSLPVLQPSVQAPDVDLGGQSEPSFRVAFLIHHYFEWVGTFEFKETPPQMESFTHFLRLRETARGDDDEADVIMQWRQIDGQPRVFNNNRTGVVFVFQ